MALEAWVKRGILSTYNISKAMEISSGDIEYLEPGVEFPETERTDLVRDRDRAIEKLPFRLRVRVEEFSRGIIAIVENTIQTVGEEIFGRNRKPFLPYPYTLDDLRFFERRLERLLAALQDLTREQIEEIIGPAIEAFIRPAGRRSRRTRPTPNNNTVEILKELGVIYFYMYLHLQMTEVRETKARVEAVIQKLDPPRQRPSSGRMPLFPNQ